MVLGSKRAEDIVAEFSNQRILVVGDLMLDRYIFGEAERISPEAPVPVVRVSEEREVPGGASNVGLNIKTLGGEASLCGLTGKDFHGLQLRELLLAAELDIGGVIEASGCPTTVKTRVLAQRQQIVRIDRENGDQPGKNDVTELLCAKVRELADDATGIVIEDYGKGVIRQAVVDTAISAATDRGIPVGFDPKDNHELNIRGVTVATPNRKETFDACGVRDKHPSPPPLEDGVLIRAGATLLDRWGPKLLMTTLGANGMLLQAKDSPVRHVPTRAREVFDVSGAGDTVIAVCVLALAAGADYFEAAELANFAAGVVVGKLGTATTSAEELLNFIA